MKLVNFVELPDMTINIEKESIIKAFEFNAENIFLTIYIRKIIYKGILKMFIDATITVNNDEIVKYVSQNGSSINTSLLYKDSPFFWISTNDWKGLRWKTFSNETKFGYYRDITGMKDLYIEQRKFIPLISQYFYESITHYKNLKLLYETEIDEIIIENKLTENNS